jgi:hypothetical protein
VYGSERFEEKDFIYSQKARELDNDSSLLVIETALLRTA